MSLLNQVLQDLDARSPQTAAGFRTAAPSIVEHAAADFESVDVARTAILVALAAALLFGALGIWLWQRDTSVPEAREVAIGQVERQSSQLVAVTAPGPVGIAPGTLAAAAGETTRAAPRTVPAAVPDNVPETTVREQDVLASVAAPAAVDAAKAPPMLALRNDSLEGDARSSDVAKATKVIPAMPPAPPVIRRSDVDPLVTVRDAIGTGELSEAERLLRQHLSVTPVDRQARELLVGLLLRGERQEEAMQELRTGLRHHPGNAAFVLIKARLLAESGLEGEAISLLQRPGMETSGEAQRRQMLAALYQKTGRYADAAGEYRLLVSANPRLAAGWVGLAISQDALGESREAAEGYRRALQIGGLPSAADAYARRRLDELGQRYE